MQWFYRHLLQPLLLLSILLVAIAGWRLYKQQFTIATAPIPDQGLTGLVTINNNIIRLTDGKEQAVLPTMRQVFLSPFDIAVFGPNAEKPNEQVVYLLTDHVARIKNIDSQMAPITNIEQSPNGNYLLLTTQEPDAPPTYCVAEKQAQDLKPCQSVIGDIVTSKEYTPNESPTVYWNMNKAQELLIEFPSDIETVFSFDPWDKKATRRDRTYINTEAEGAQIKKDQSLGKYYDIRRYGPLTIMKESNPVSNKRPPQFWYWIPPSSPIVWITKYQFIYTKGKNAYIVNVREKKRSVLSTRAEDISSITTYQASILGQ